jgi:DNA-binding transcriptional LysR family regulator
MIELRQFRQFIAVAEELNFRRAAQRLRMAQPPLTAAIKKIEKELGTTLIERTNRVACLTKAGRIFLEGAQRTVAQADRALGAAKLAGTGLTGLLRISFVPSAAHDLLPRILRTFREKYTGIDLDLNEATTAQQVAALMEDRTDLGFVMLPLHNAEGLAIDILIRDQLVLALPEGHPLGRRDAVELKKLANEQWILVPPQQAPGLHGRVLAACAQAGFIPHVAQEALQMDTIASFVASGIGVSMVSPSLAGLGRRGVSFHRMTGLGTPVNYELALTYRRPSPLTDAFIQIAAASVRVNGRNSSAR